MMDIHVVNASAAAAKQKQTQQRMAAPAARENSAKNWRSISPRVMHRKRAIFGGDSKCRTACRLPGMVRCGYFLIARRMRLAMYLCPLTVGWASVAVMAKGMGT